MPQCAAQEVAHDALQQTWITKTCYRLTHSAGGSGQQYRCPNSVGSLNQGRASSLPRKQHAEDRPTAYLISA